MQTLTQGIILISCKEQKPLPYLIWSFSWINRQRAELKKNTIFKSWLDELRKLRPCKSTTVAVNQQ